MPTKTVAKRPGAAEKPTVEDYKKLLGDNAKKKVTIDLKAADLTGSLEAITKRIKKKVAASEIEGDFTITNSGERRSHYNYNTRRYEYTGGPKIVGYRPYTDAEIEKQGARLLADKVKKDAREARQRAANVAKFNKLAEVLGYEPITDADE